MRARAVMVRPAAWLICNWTGGSSAIGPVARGGTEAGAVQQVMVLQAAQLWSAGEVVQREWAAADADNGEPCARQGYYVWARLIEALADLGYGPNNLVSGPSHALASRAWSCEVWWLQIQGSLGFSGRGALMGTIACVRCAAPLPCRQPRAAALICSLTRAASGMLRTPLTAVHRPAAPGRACRLRALAGRTRACACRDCRRSPALIAQRHSSCAP